MTIKVDINQKMLVDALMISARREFEIKKAVKEKSIDLVRTSTLFARSQMSEEIRDSLSVKEQEKHIETVVENLVGKLSKASVLETLATIATNNNELVYVTLMSEAVCEKIKRSMKDATREAGLGSGMTPEDALEKIKEMIEDS